jgi:hypothetical protein
VVALAVATASPAHAKLSLQFDRTSARPADRVYLTFGQYFTSPNDVVHVYLVRASVLGRVVRRELGRGPRLGPPPRLSGVVKVGRTTSGKAGLRFRVPRVRAGRYAAAIWCSTCSQPDVFVSFPSSVPDDAFVRAGRALLRVGQ